MFSIYAPCLGEQLYDAVLAYYGVVKADNLSAQMISKIVI